MKQIAKGSQDPNIVKEVYGKSRSVAVMRLTFLIGFLLLASFALGQAGMVQSVASIGESGGLVKVIPFAPVVVCGYPANTSSPPCSNLITTYTTPTKAGTCGSSAQVIWPGTSACKSTADPSGNFSFFADTGQNATYYFKYLSVWFGPFAVVVGGGGGGTPGGSNGQLQINNAGTFGGVTTATPIINLFSGCSGAKYLGADGGCHDSGASPWNSILTPTGNMSLALGLNTSLFTIGDFGASPIVGAYKITDSATNTLDTTTNFLVNTGASSRHNPVAFQIQGTNQFQVCWQSGPQGEIIIGSAVGCAAISQSPFAKFMVETATASHNNVRLYQKSTSATGTMLEMNNATAAGSGYNFWTACTGASTTDTSCTNLVAKLDGSGFLTVAKVITTTVTSTGGLSVLDSLGNGMFISGGDVNVDDGFGDQLNLNGGDVGITAHGIITAGGSSHGVVAQSNDGDIFLNAFNATSNTTALLNGSAFTTNVPVVAPGMQVTGITGLTQCVHVSTTGVMSGTGSDCGAGGGGSGLSGQTAKGIPYAATPTTSTASTTPGTNQGTYVVVRSNTIQGTATNPQELQMGDCSGAGTITGASTSYTILYGDVIGCNVVHDISASGAATITIPTPTILNNPAPIFVYSNYSAQTDTLTPTTFTISIGHTAAAASLSVPSATACKVQLDPVNASTWKADCHPTSTTGGGGGSVNVNGSPVSSPNFNATTPAAGAGFQNCTWQVTGSNASCETALPTVNGSNVSGPPNFNSTTPLAGAGFQNATIQSSGSNVSVEVPIATMPFLWLPMASQGVPQAATSGQFDGTANNLVCRSFSVPNQITATKFTASVSLISAGQTFNIGIYDSSGNLIRDSGSMSAGTATTVTSTVSAFTLTPGNTYAQCVAITDSTAQVLGLAANVAFSGMANKNATRDFACSNTLSAGAMPPTCGTATPQGSKGFLVLLEP